MVWDYTSQDFIIVGICILFVLVLHILLHKKRIGNEYLLIRSLLLLLGLFGLVILYLKPKTSETTKASNITLHTDSTIDLPTGVKSVHEILNSDEAYDTIIIKGNGLHPDALALLDSFHLKFEPREKLKGITEVHIPKIKEKQAWSLTGTLNPEGIQKITLEQSSGKLLETTTDEEGNFSFRPTSNNSGHYTYNITAIYTDTTITETIPIEVLPSEKWNLLAYSSAPSFELNYLKNYWVKLGNGFSLRQQVSQDRYKETFLNNSKIALDKINSETLRKFNFLVIDVKSWNQLKPDEQKLALNYVASGRIGLLFFGLSEGDQLANINNVKVVDEKEIKLADNDMKLQQILFSGSLNTLKYKSVQTAAIKRYALGNIGFMSINNTHRFILANQNTAYQNIWANVFSELYIQPTEDVVIKSSNWNMEEEELLIDIFSTKAIEDKAILNGNHEMPIQQTSDQEGLYYIPLKTANGWHSIKIESSKSSHRFFVHAVDSWQAKKQSYLHKVNTQAANKPKQLGKRENTITKELPFYWGLLLSLLGFGGLWIHERIYI